MSKQVIIDRLASDLGISKAQAQQNLNAVLEAIKDGIVNSETGKFRIPELGTFSVKDTPERQGRNPQTGEPLTIAAGKRITFKASTALKEEV